MLANVTPISTIIFSISQRAKELEAYSTGISGQHSMLVDLHPLLPEYCAHISCPQEDWGYWLPFCVGIEGIVTSMD